MNELTPPDNAGPLATGTVSPRWAFRSEPNPSPYASRVAPLGARSLNSDTQALWATEHSLQGEGLWIWRRRRCPTDCRRRVRHRRPIVDC